MNPRAAPTRQNLKTQVADNIRDRILSGELKPGTKVDQDGLARELEVSKLPVREAIIQLTTEGLVNSPVGRGSYVAPLEPEDVHDHYESYGLVASVAARRATEKMSDADIDGLEAILDAMEATADSAEHERLNIQFHKILNRTGGSGRLLAILKMLANSLPTGFYEFADGWSDEAQHHHREIVAALRRRDADEVGRAVAAHLSIGADFAVTSLRNRGFWTQTGTVDQNSAS